MKEAEFEKLYTIANNRLIELIKRNGKQFHVSVLNETELMQKFINSIERHIHQDNTVALVRIDIEQYLISEQKEIDNCLTNEKLFTTTDYLISHDRKQSPKSIDKKNPVGTLDTKPKIVADEDKLLKSPSTFDGVLDKNVFRQIEDGWELCFSNKKCILRDYKGLHLIKQMLENPDKKFTVDVLEDSSTYNDKASDNREYNISKAPIGTELDPGVEYFDGKTYKYLKPKIDEIIDKIEIANDTGDSVKLADLEIEKRKILSYLKGGKSIHWRDRKIGGADEKARKRVSKNIKLSIKKIKNKHFSLGEHLNRYISIGSNSLYKPEKEMKWRTKIS